MASGPLNRSGLAKNEKYAHVQGKLNTSHKKVTQRYKDEAADLTAQITINNRKAMELERELQETIAHYGGNQGSGVEALRQEILDMQRQTRECEAQIESMQGDFVRNKTIFEESKNYVEQLHQNLRDVNEDNEKLRSENFKLQLQTQELNDLQQELRDTLEARDQIERSIRNVTAEPFLKKKEEGNTIAFRI